MPKKKKGVLYYVVRKGYKPGIYRTWEECRIQVSGFPYNEYKSFSNLVEAEEYLNSAGVQNCASEWSVDGKLLEANNNQDFSDSFVAAENTSLKRSTCSKGLSVDNTSLKVSQASETEVKDSLDYLSLERMYNEPSDQERDYARFSSFSEMCDLLCDSLVCAANMSEINNPKFLLHQGTRSLDTYGSLVDSDDDDDSELFHFKSELHLFNYLGLDKVKASTAILNERYFHSVYKLTFSGTSDGNPGKSGAGILLRRPDDSVAFKLMLGLGRMTNVLAEFRAFILGLRVSLDRGIYLIQVSGQFTWINGLQEYLSNRDVMDLEKEADALINTFKLFLVKHEANGCITASSLANRAVSLPDGCLKKINKNKYQDGLSR